MKIIDRILRSNLFKVSLRVKMLLAFVLPMLALILAFSYYHNFHQELEMEELIKNSTINLGDMALSGMKNSMLRNDREAVNRILNNIGKNPSIQHMKIVDLDFRVAISTDSAEVGSLLDTRQTGCVECHNTSATDRPRAVGLRIDEDLLRVVSPIQNEPECQTCHEAQNKHLGILIIDAPLSEVLKRVQEDRIRHVGMTVFSVLIIAVISYWMIHWLVVKRVGVVYEYLNKFASGDFSIRIPKVWRTEDEITQLADHFNHIVDSLERHQKEEREIAIIRQEVIAEERERIAHELHDGVAQLLAYLTTKISATRIVISRNQIQEAEVHLIKMDEAVQKQTLDVRSMIAGLRMLGQAGTGLAISLQDYAEVCNRLMDLNIILSCDPRIEKLQINPQTELHLLRIAQESISNARKHSSATEIKVNLTLNNNVMSMEIIDNGIGFDPQQPSLWRAPHFGLRTMGERAEKIGASFKVESAQGEGAHILVSLKLLME